MGNQQSSEMMPSSPMITKLVRSLNLDSEKQGLTYSLSHHHFAIQFCRADKTKFDRSMNPFCPMKIKNSQNWMTCCLITPLMAIACPLYIINKSGEYNNNCQIEHVYQNLMSNISIGDAIEISKQNLCLVVLEKPYWRVGWAGISFIRTLEQLMVLEMKYVNHPQCVLVKENNRMVHMQQVKRFRIPKTSKMNSQFVIEIKGSTGALICKIVEKKPYIIGVQITEQQIMFFNQSTFNKIRQQARSYIKDNGGEKQILKQIDIRQFQIQTEL